MQEGGKPSLLAEVAEPADARVSKTRGGNLMWVRFPPSVPSIDPHTYRFSETEGHFVAR